jgi:hypothetical protein
MENRAPKGENRDFLSTLTGSPKIFPAHNRITSHRPSIEMKSATTTGSPAIDQTLE